MDAPEEPIELEIEETIRPLVRLGVVRAAPVAAGPAGPELRAECEDLCRALAARHAGRAPGEIPGLAPARELYRAFGIDPTRTRPSSEALLRRVLRGLPLPVVTNAVDLANLCSLEFLLPIGLYDAGAIRGRIVLRRGEPGESYPGIRKDAVHLDGRPVLADAEGPFGNPTSDSLRTSVTAATRSLLFVIFAPAALAASLVEAHARAALEAIVRHLAPPGETVRGECLVMPR